MRKSKVIASVLFAATLGVANVPGIASARNDSCDDGRGNPHYCYHPDNDPDITYYTVEATKVVETHKTGFASAYCDTDSDSYAVGGGEMTNPAEEKVVFPQRAYITQNAPIFVAPGSPAIGWTATVLNGTAHPITLTTYATCVK